MALLVAWVAGVVGSVLVEAIWTHCETRGIVSEEERFVGTGRLAGLAVGRSEVALGAVVVARVALVVSGVLEESVGTVREAGLVGF